MINTKEYWESRLGAQYNLGGVGFKGLSEAYNRWLYRLRRRLFIKTVRSTKIDMSRARVLDVGSGTGFYINCWKEVGAWSIEGLDLTEVAVQRLSSTYKDIYFRCQDISSEHFLDDRAGHFDIISAMDVMFHIVDDNKFEKAIGNVYESLREGGMFIWSDNFLHGPQRQSAHIVHRRLVSIEKVLKNQGFKIISRKPNFYLMNQPVDSEGRILSRIWGIINRVGGHSEVAGSIIGGIIYPIELLLVSVMKESPTTEIMVCQKVF